MADVSLKNINKIYDNNVQAVFDFNLDIKDKEFVVFVGPSGCGKSTTLRMVAGLEEITSGELYIDGKLCNDVAPKDRDIAMVFQSYALYPHMSVYENMAFGLKIRKLPKEEIDKRVKDAAKILEIEQYLDRKPKALSGGQRQRVALGRAIVRNAKVFLMDEPLSNLDAKLRVQMRSEIIKLHQDISATTIYVTHDQTEAMTMADRIVVMKDGYVQQIGSPREIYNTPANIFVGGFLGSPAMNFLHAKYLGGKVQVADKQWEVPEMFIEAMKPYVGKDVMLGIRPEDIHGESIVHYAFPSTSFKFNVEINELLGHEYVVHGHIGEDKVIAKVPARLDSRPGSEVELYVDMPKIHFFDLDTTNIII